MMDWQERVFTAQRTLNDVSAALRNQPHGSPANLRSAEILIEETWTALRDVCRELKAARRRREDLAHRGAIKAVISELRGARRKQAA
jgi:hypothetical protein